MRKQSNASSLVRAKPRIGIDLLGSDVPPHQLLQSVLSTFHKVSSEADLVLFLRKEDLTIPLPEELSAIFVTEIVNMDDSPLAVLRKKKNSSIGKAMSMLKEKEIDAFISAGNTGALMASAKTTLKTLKGIQRPALLTLMPAKNKEVAVLDVGANTKCKPSYLLQFAHMGIAYQKTRGIEKPTAGLLNIGSEARKGTPEHQQAYLALQKLNHKAPYPTFLGNIEGRDVFEGPVDILVTDGFTGNVFLKTAEGIAGFLLEELKHTMEQVQNPTLALQQTLQQCKKRLDYSEYPGALLCGVEGIVMKCHGSSKPQALEHSIEAVIALVSGNFLEKVKSQLSL